MTYKVSSWTISLYALTRCVTVVRRDFITRSPLHLWSVVVVTTATSCHHHRHHCGAVLIASRRRRFAVPPWRRRHVTTAAILMTSLPDKVSGERFACLRALLA